MRLVRRTSDSASEDDKEGREAAASHAAGRPALTWRELFSGANAVRSIVLAGAVVLHGFFMFITATVLPSIVAEIGGVAFYAWVSTIFGVGSIAGAMLAPAILRGVPARRAYQLGLLLFAVGSIACAAAPSMAVVILGRATQGLAGGLLAATATTMIPVLFPDELRSRAVAMVSSVWGPISLAGPFVGGIFAEFGSWRGAFLFALPLVFALGVLAHRTLPSNAPQRGPAGSAFSAAQILRLALIAGAVVVLSAASVPGGVSAAIAGIATAMIFCATALRLDRRASRRVLLEGAFRLSTPVGTSSAAMALLVLGVGAGSFIPYVLTVAHGASPIVAGYVAAPMSLAWSIAALASAGASMAASRRMVAGAPVVAAAAMIGVAWALSAGNVAFTVVAWMIFGASVGMIWPHLASRLIGYSSVSERAAAGGFVTTLQILGGTFGAALAGMIANLAGLAKSAAAADVAHGGSLLFLTFALPPLLAALVSARLLHITKEGIEKATAGEA